MKSFALIFFILSISCIIIGYMELKIIDKKKQKTTEYRLVPNEIIDSQITNKPLDFSYNYLFNQEVLSTI